MEKRTIRPEDLYALAVPGEIDISPDGTQVAYTITRVEKDENKSYTDIFLADLSASTNRRLTQGGEEGSPVFSPDGKRLAFISSRDKKSQIHILDLTGGEAWSLPTPQNVSGPLRWFPDGKAIAYRARVFSHEEGWQPYAGAPETDGNRLKAVAEKIHAKDADAKADKDKATNKVKVITRFKYRRDGSGYLGDLRWQVFFRAVPTDAPLEKLPAESQAVTSGDYDHNSIAISPCGHYIVTDSRRDEDADWNNTRDLWIFDIQKGTHHLLYQSKGPASDPHFSPGGDFVAFCCHNNAFGESTTTGMYLLDVKDFFVGLQEDKEPEPYSSQSARFVTRSLDRPALSGGFWEEEFFYFSVADRGKIHTYRVQPQGEPELVHGMVGKSYPGLRSKAGTVAYIMTDFGSFEEVVAIYQGNERVISNCNLQLAEQVTLAKGKRFNYRSDDGQNIDAWLLYPPDFCDTCRHPLMLFIHGGPHGWYGPRFMLDAQLFAAQGYVVMLTNPRGSESYGQDFARIIDTDWGNLDYRDVMAGVQEILKSGFLDPDKVFAQGWSYGGYLACWIVTQTDIFTAVCAGAPVSNLLSGYGTSDITLADEHEYGANPWTDGGHLLKHSPLTYAHQVTTPIMLMHGETDFRCPVGQTEEFYIALRRQGKEAVMVRYPDEYHGLKKPIHRLDRLERLLAWFNYYRNLEV